MDIKKLNKYAEEYIRDYHKGKVIFLDFQRSITTLLKDVCTERKMKPLLAEVKKKRGICKSSLQLLTLLLKNKEPKADASSVMKLRKMREDAYWDSKPRVGNFAGRKKSEKWILLKKAHEIVSWKHVPEWGKQFGVDKAKWFKLFFKFAKAIDDGIEVTKLSECIGIGVRELEKLTSEFSILLEVDNLFNEEVERAIARNNEDDRMFLNTVKEVWGDRAPAILKDFREKKRGRKSNPRVREGRYQQVKEYSQMDSHIATSSGFHRRAYPIALCRLAYLAHGLLFIYKTVEIDMADIYIKCLEERKARHEAISRARRKIDQVQKIIDEFNILRSELGREIRFKEKPLSLLDTIPSIVLPK